MTTRAPRAFIVRTRVRAPGLRVMRLSTSAITLAGRPASSATRSRERRFKRDLAVRRPFGDGRDAGAAPAQVASSSTHS